MKKLFLFFSCLFIALLLLPGGIASWGDMLSLSGSIVTGDWSEESTKHELTSQEKEGEYSNDAIDEEGSGEAKNDYTLSLAIEGKGDVKIIEGDDNETIKEGNYIYTSGSKLELSASPDEGWELSSWVLDDNRFSNHKLSFIIKGDIDITVVFSKAKEDGNNNGNGEDESDDLSFDKEDEDREKERSLDNKEQSPDEAKSVKNDNECEE